MIAIIDYDVGNVRNVERALKKVGLDAVITRDEQVIDESQAIVLPGVGAFRDSMKALKASGLIPCIRRNVNKGKYILGICLGMQLLYENSYEDGVYEGLGFLKGDIVKLDVPFKVPHMGWNSLIKAKDDPLVEHLGNEAFVYFVHSYYLKPVDQADVVMWSDYGVEVPAIIRQGNIIGMQFHPEKSGGVGEQLLENFKELIT